MDLENFTFKSSILSLWDSRGAMILKPVLWDIV